jgi:hypothetical protein
MKIFIVWVSVVGIKTRYGLDGSRIDCRRGTEIFLAFETVPEAHPASCTWVLGLFPDRGDDRQRLSSFVSNW